MYMYRFGDKLSINKKTSVIENYIEKKFVCSLNNPKSIL